MIHSYTLVCTPTEVEGLNPQTHFYKFTSLIIPSEHLTSSFSECSLIDFLQYEQKIE